MWPRSSRATQRAADLTRQLLVFSRHDHLRLEAVDVNRVALETQRLLDRTLGEDVELVGRARRLSLSTCWPTAASSSRC